MRLSDVARLLGGKLDGDPAVEIHGLSAIEEAGSGELTFLANPKYRKFLATTGAAAVLVPEGAETGPTPGGIGPALLRVADPYRAFLRLADEFYPPPPPPAEGIHPSAVVAPTAVLGSGCSIGAHALIGEGCRLGDRVVVSHGSVVEAGVTMGTGTRVMENVVVKSFTRIGERVTLYPGCVIGGDGFGFTPKEDGSREKIPQRGIVVIGDDAEIGSNCTIDRAMIGETRIGRGVKLDNLIQIGHNVVIGDHTVIVAQSGIAGSTRIGEYCMIAGQVGIVGHLRIADRVRIGAQAGVSRSLTEAGKTYSSSPVKEHRRALRIEGAIRALPEMLSELQALRKEVDRLRGNRDAAPTSGDQQDPS
jgi:UDP-3-O-[3-hydroxymyristoyl] glucosamine N-acyltransferase